MLAAVIADTHGKLMQADLIKKINCVPDIVILLGDVSESDLEAMQDFLLFENTPMIGVIGNHDDREFLKRHKITDLHRKVLDYNGITFGGYGGSIKYKDNDYYLLHTNEESEQELEELPPCDILICHDKPCFRQVEKCIPKDLEDDCESNFLNFLKDFFKKLLEEESKIVRVEEKTIVHAHSGLTGIAKYIEEKKPRLVLHGHLHDRNQTKQGSTEIRCCYYVEQFEL